MHRSVHVLAAALALAASPGQAEPYRALPRLAPGQVQQRRATASRAQRALTHGEGLVGATVPGLETAPPAEVVEAEPAPGGPLIIEVPPPAEDAAREDAAPVILAEAGPERPDESNPPGAAPAAAPDGGAAPAESAPAESAPALSPKGGIDDADLRRREDPEEGQEEQRRSSLGRGGATRLAEAEPAPAPAATTVAAVQTTPPVDDPEVSSVVVQGDGTYAMIVRTRSGDRIAVVIDGDGRLLGITGAR